MSDDWPSDTWRVRGPDNVVHWTDDPEIRTSTSTRCGRTLANVYDPNDRRGWHLQLVVSTDVVTCMGCITAGQEPPPPPDIEWNYDTGDYERVSEEEDDADS